MIQPSALLRSFEARYAREAYRDVSYPAALALYTGLWMEAQLAGERPGVEAHAGPGGGGARLSL